MRKKRDHSGRIRHRGECACGAETSDRRYPNCRKCYESVSNPGVPIDPEGYAEDSAKLDRIEERITAMGRCDVCRLWLPCGGHMSAAEYVHQRREDPRWDHE